MAVSQTLMVFFFTRRDKIYIYFYKINDGVDKRLTNNSMDCVAEKDLVKVFFASAFINHGVRDLYSQCWTFRGPG